MKIGVITFWWTKDNYGQILQILALQKCLKAMGHEAFLIRYHAPSDIIPIKKHRKLIDYFNIKKIMSSVRRRIIGKKKAYLQTQYEVKDNLRSFDLFCKNEIEVSSEIYYSIDELKRDPPLADAYIVGSDQVWNFPNVQISLNNIKAYFLDFGELDVKRISYAASFSRDNFSDQYKSVVAPLIARFNGISVRETSGVHVCQTIGQEGAKLVLDPTLLILKEQWSKYIKSVEQEKKYCFLYLLGNKTDLKMQHIDKYVRDQHFDLRYVASQGRFDNYQKFYPSIYEWLGFISNSEVMITNSFHGLVFAILFNKPFIALPLVGDFYKGMNTRVQSLLEMLGLENRMCNSSKMEEVINQKIDWDRVNTLLKKERIKSMQFLTESLC